jgi:hypothetical protein
VCPKILCEREVVRDCLPDTHRNIGAARIAPRGIVTPANALLGAEVVAIAARNLEARARTSRAALDPHGVQ